ncbi:MAG: Jag N-terminal domain-containing protein, partial [Pyramidobacter sp.]|nr:Jag N-terminal domain-containing protein [Pyramidobacter sp.]
MENMTTSLNDEVLVLEVSSEDEARAQAAARWGIPADEVVLNVIEEGKSFLGLFGRKLKIEARRPAASAPAAAADAEAEPESSSDFMTLLKKVINAAGLELDA